MPLLSAALEILLTLVCLSGARGAWHAGNDFLAAGFLWVAVAAFVGAFNLGGFTAVDPTLPWLSQVARGPGMLAMALGLRAALRGPAAADRYAACALSIVGAAAVHLLLPSRWLAPAVLALGLPLPLALLAVAREGAAARRTPVVAAALVCLALLLVVAFVLPWLPIGDAGLLRAVDVMHLALIPAYAALAEAARGCAGIGAAASSPASWHGRSAGE